MADDEMRFSLDWLLGAAERVPQLSVCDRGHLVIRRNTHWQPVALTDDMRALVCRIAVHEEP